jgi:REP element-mobilizing transposase RayT
MGYDFGSMNYRPFNGVPCAYHLHYHFCFQTKYSRPRFAFPEADEWLAATLQSICHHNRYHLLGHSVEKDKVYCLISLKPDDVVSVAARALKSNLARQFNLQMADAKGENKEPALWSIGYYVGSIGKASKKAAERYINNQGEHHGIRDEQSREIMRWVNAQPPMLRASHVTFDLSYHVVLVTSKRVEVFDQYIAPNLFEGIRDVSAAKGFYIERMSLLYDHIHALVRTTPSLSIRDCVQDVMNHSWRFMMDRYEGVLKNTSAYDVWTRSFYVSTVGRATTAQVKSFLKRGS